MKLTLLFYEQNKDWTIPDLFALIVDMSIIRHFVIADVHIPESRKLVEMAKHRLMFDFMNHKGPVFFCRDGSLVDTAKVAGNPIASVEYPIVVGNCWTEEDE